MMTDFETYTDRRGQVRRRHKALHVAGHRLRIEFSGERGREERSSTGYCTCGWEESASTQDVVRQEYRWHLERRSKNA